MVILKTFHTQEFRGKHLEAPQIARGNEQWLGDGFYFWEDYEIAKWWGQTKKCKRPLLTFSVYNAELEFTEDDFIDTVFNETDYRNFVEAIEKFAQKCAIKLRHKPTLEEFNDFIADFKIWDKIKVIRFQDVPENDNLISVKGFYYKKRIQIRVNDVDIIGNFTHHKDFSCVV